MFKDKINQFCEVTVDTLNKLLDINIKSLDIEEIQKPIQLEQIIAAVNIIGEVRGGIYCSITYETEKYLVQKFSEKYKLKKMEQSDKEIMAIGEIVNIIFGKFLSIIQSSKVVINLTSPIFLRDERCFIFNNSQQTLLIPFMTEGGVIKVYIELQGYKSIF